MNTIKIILISLITLCTVNFNALGQISTIGKATVKGGIKSTVKQTVKSDIRAATKEVIIDEIKEKGLRYGIKSVVTEQINKELTQVTAKRLSQQAFKEGCEELLEKSVKITGEKVITRKIKNLAKGAMESSSKNFLVKKRTYFLVKNSKDLSNNIFSKKNNIITPPRISLNLEEIIGKTGLNEVEKFLPEASSKQILINDLLDNPQLVKLFQKRPTYIQNYAQCLNSRLRTDVTHLRYLNYHADSYADACVFSRSKYIRASDLQFIDDNLGNTIILNSKSGVKLGVLKENTITIASDHSLLNMRLMKNMRYKVDNSIFITDHLGRPIEVQTYIAPKFTNTIIYQRDKQVQRDFRKARCNASKLDSNKLIDDAGHLIAHDLGGISDGINIVPQNRNLNRGAYKKMENKIKKDIKEGHSVSIRIKLTYNGASERPSDFIYEYTKDGVYTSTMVYKNMLEVN